MMMTRDFVRLGLLPALVIRLGMVAYSVYHDKRNSVKYTDIDYQVFTDAAGAMLSPDKHGWVGSPYDRATYRYTPLLALLLTPNHFVHPCWGKALFSLCDVIIGWLLCRLCPSRTDPAYHARVVGLVWLLNPFVINISSRGSSEALLGVVIVGFLYSAKRLRWDLAALLLGVAVHLKVYPFLYGAAVLARLRVTTEHEKRRNFSKIPPLLGSINRQQIRFAAISFSTFMALNSVMYSIWGLPFLESSYLYHLKRLDHRHNFSPYFYPIYLRFTQPVDDHSTVIDAKTAVLNGLLEGLQHPLTSFVPQMTLSLALGFYYGKRDLTFACFIQTYTFVIFNKVSTSQYFMWYLWFIPTLVNKIKLSLAELLTVLSLWILTQSVWLSYAYKLEFLGQPVFLSLWLASIFFLIGNSGIVGCLIIAFSRASSFTNSIDSKIKLN